MPKTIKLTIDEPERKTVIINTSAIDHVLESHGKAIINLVKYYDIHVMESIEKVKAILGI